VQVVGGAWLELGDQMEVEISGVARFGMDEEASTADVRRQVEQSSEDVLKKSDTEPATLMVDVDAESSEQCYRLGIATGALKETPRCCYGMDLGHAPGVVGDNPRVVLFGHNEDAGCSGVCRLSGITP
jgi:hypothetical protein